ncbi:MAG: WD40/YVTN/BNR-like repeat-containing protein, partial [Candidatus Acidiferrales bacterium]
MRKWLVGGMLVAMGWVVSLTATAVMGVAAGGPDRQEISDLKSQISEGSAAQQASAASQPQQRPAQGGAQQGQERGQPGKARGQEQRSGESAQEQKPGEREGGERRQEPFSSATFNGLRLRSIGPAVASGRISDFAVHPKNRATYYVAVASGGVWKTENSGTTWRAIFDSQGSYSIGVVRLDPNNPEVVWVGTGENNAQRSVSYGDGVYRSDDGG